MHRQHKGRGRYHKRTTKGERRAREKNIERNGMDSRRKNERGKKEQRSNSRLEKYSMSKGKSVGGMAKGQTRISKCGKG